MTFNDLRVAVDRMTQDFKMKPELIPELLAIKARFYKYSLNNTIAIQLQNPGATFVASYLDWRKKGYSVKHDGNAILVWTQTLVKSFNRENGESVKVSEATPEEKQRIHAGEIPLSEKLDYKAGYVYDIAQTTCPPADYSMIYSMGYESLKHDQLYKSLMEFAKRSGFAVKEDNLSSIALNGFYRTTTDEIVISHMLKDSRKLAVLCHELAHGLMHKTSTQPKSVKEFEAEGLAVMLLARMGLPVEDHNRMHLKSYYEKIDQEQYNIEDSFARMQRAYNHVVDGFEQEILKLPPEVEYTQEQQTEQQGEITANFLKDLR